MSRPKSHHRSWTSNSLSTLSACAAWRGQSTAWTRTTPSVEYRKEFAENSNGIPHCTNKNRGTHSASCAHSLYSAHPEVLSILRIYLAYLAFMDKRKWFLTGTAHLTRAHSDLALGHGFWTVLNSRKFKGNSKGIQKTWEIRRSMCEMSLVQLFVYLVYLWCIYVDVV